MNKLNIKYTLTSLFLLFFMCISFSTGIFTNNLLNKDLFQADSESFVSGVYIGEHYDLKSNYNLYRVFSVFNTLYSYNNIKGVEYIDDLINPPEKVGYEKGYSLNQKGTFLLRNNFLSKYCLENCKKVELSNNIYEIISYKEITEDLIIVNTNGQQLFNVSNCGSLSDIIFYDKDNNVYTAYLLTDYKSQFGFQGVYSSFIFSLFNKPTAPFNFLYAFNIFSLSLTLCLISYFLYKKYDLFYSIIFFATSLLSPWITCFSNNLYWVEYTWFLPILIGLYASVNIKDNKKIHISYLLISLTILLKCLCGYEYISTILVSSCTFLFADFISNIGNKEVRLKYFRILFNFSMFALLGFFIAILLHAKVVGNNDLVAGLNYIYNENVLSKTFLATSKDFSNGADDLKYALDAPFSKSIQLYLNPTVDLILGVPAKLFKILLLLTAIFSFVFIFMKNKKISVISILFFTFLTGTFSWYILAKTHSVMHPHMNYVLYYLGMFQTMIYLNIYTLFFLLKKITQKIKKQED